MHVRWEDIERYTLRITSVIWMRLKMEHQHLQETKFSANHEAKWHFMQFE